VPWDGPFRRERERREREGGPDLVRENKVGSTDSSLSISTFKASFYDRPRSCVTCWSASQITRGETATKTKRVLILVLTNKLATREGSGLGLFVIPGSVWFAEYSLFD
jgi:hypothetical protein